MAGIPIVVVDTVSKFYFASLPLIKFIIKLVCAYIFIRGITSILTDGIEPTLLKSYKLNEGDEINDN